MASMRARGQGLASPAAGAPTLADDPQRTDGVASMTTEATPLPQFPLNLALADYMWDTQRLAPAAPLKPALSPGPCPAPTSTWVLRNLHARELHSAEAAADAAFGRAPQPTLAGPQAAQPSPSLPASLANTAPAAKGAASPWAQAAAAAGVSRAED